jgi:nucleoside-diphosphate-sugar epimerase
MNVLVTGAFGNIGRSTTTELLNQGQRVRCFDVRNRCNERAARQFRGQVEVVWGDLRRPKDIVGAVRDQVAVIHLAFIIPKLSSTGFESEDHPDWARQINVDGTRHLVEAMEAEPRARKLLFASSYHIYGRTQDRPPPRTVSDPVQPTEHYAQHKIEAEALVRSSTLEWTILRLAAALPIAMKLDPGMFDIPLDNRMEYVHTKDVGLAFANAVRHPSVWGKTLLIGGGARCQYTYREITRQVLEEMGVGMLPEEAFSSTPFPTDWLDTAESQQLLRYQRYTLVDYVQDMGDQLGTRRHLIRLFRPVIRRLLLKQSAHYQAGRPGWMSAVLQGLKILKGKPDQVRIR